MDYINRSGLKDAVDVEFWPYDKMAHEDFHYICNSNDRIIT
jgi:hypothetical protein